MNIYKYINVALVLLLLLCMIFSFGIALGVSTEDFLLYSLGGLDTDRLGRTTNQVTFSNIDQGDDCYIYDNKGVDSITGIFSYDFEFRITSASSVSIVQLWAVSDNMAGNFVDLVDNDFLYVRFQKQTTSNRILAGQHSLAGAQQTDYFTIDVDVPYYATVARYYSSGYKLRIIVYSDAARTIEVGNETVTLDTSADYQYLYGFMSLGAADVGSYASGYVKNMRGDIEYYSVPTVFTYPQGWSGYGGDVAYLHGYASSDIAITDAGFDIGIATGNYTDEYEGTFSGDYDFYSLADDLVIGETYYFRAKAENALGWGYGEELSFQWTPNYVNLYLSEPTVTQSISTSGNFSLAFFVEQTPVISANVTGYLSDTFPVLEEDIPVYLVNAVGNRFVFSTWNGTQGSGPYAGHVLLPETTYYYRGSVTFESVIHWTEIKSFNTGTASFPDKPIVSISQISDISDAYNSHYVVEIKGHVATTNTTDFINYQGVVFSLNSASDILLPVIYNYKIYDRNPDNTFSIILSLAAAEWYSGEELYFQMYARTPYYGEVYSIIVNFTPDVWGDDAVVDNGISADDLIDAGKGWIGITGEFGTWALLVAVLLLTALIFGIAMVGSPTGIIRSAVAVVWLLVTVGVVGAFMFTGQLGIWPIVILVGGVVALVLIFLSVKLSGGGDN